jgi:hypothetical protein
MITRFGMSEDFGMVALETVTNQYLGGDTSLACSPETAKRIDQMVIDEVHREYQKAKALLMTHTDALHELAEHLLKEETITGKQFMVILNKYLAPEQTEVTPKDTEEVDEVKKIPTEGKHNIAASTRKEEAVVKETPHEEAPVKEEAPTQEDTPSA